MVIGGGDGESASTIALRLAVPRWLARRSRVDTVSCMPSDATAPLPPAMRAVYGRRADGSRAIPSPAAAAEASRGGRFADRRRKAGACDGGREVDGRNVDAT